MRRGADVKLPETSTADSLPPLREVIARHKLGARRSLGQNFLLDTNLTRRIAREAGEVTDSLVIEIGPGPGGLTRALLEAGARRIIAIERDRRCIAALAELAEAYPGRLVVTEGDALATDIAALAAAEAGGCRIIANLPYNIATRLLIDWLPQIAAFATLTLMFQKEVAERLAAAPGSRTYGRLSVIVQWLCDVRCLFDVPARAFVPQPKVTSTVVRLTPRPAPLAPAEFADMERITAAAFGQRRKMLRSALKIVAADPVALLEQVGIEPTARAETLDVEAFCALARALRTAETQPRC
jgi:16S rRNA (adenine1518-N6/adenine1519-N6)-dimethyltransferase